MDHPDAMSDHFLQPLLASSDRFRMSLMIDGSRTPLASSVEAAVDSDSRRRGLLGRETLAPDTALVIAPCGAIHTVGMRFAIDAIFTARDGRVLKIVRAIAPRRVAACLGAFAVVEMAAHEADRHQVRVGDHLRIEAGSPPSQGPR